MQAKSEEDAEVQINRNQHEMQKAVERFYSIFFLHAKYSSDGKGLKLKKKKSKKAIGKVSNLTLRTVLLRGINHQQELRILEDESSQGLKAAAGLSTTQKQVRGCTFSLP